MGLILKDVATMLLIGDGMVGLLTPERHVRRWLGGRSLGPDADAKEKRREAIRLAAAVEAAFGLWFASRLPAKPS